MAIDDTVQHILSDIAIRLLDAIPNDTWVGHSDIARAQHKARLNPYEINVLRELSERDYLDSRRVAYGTRGGKGVFQYRKR